MNRRKLIAFAILVALLVLTVLAFLQPAANADFVTPTSSWLKTTPPTVIAINGDVDVATLPTSTSRNCMSGTKFVTIPKLILSSQNEQSYTTCATQTAYGLHSVSSGEVRLNGSNIAGPIKLSGLGNVVGGPIPNSKHILYQSGGTYGSYLYFIRNIADNITTVVQPNGSIYHQINAGINPVQIKDSAGTPLEFADTTASDNGKWVVGDVPWRGMTRVNVETGETLNFTTGYNYANGVRPKFISAISGDGRYVLTAEYSYSILKLYDLSTCSSSSNPALPAACQSKDLLPAIPSLVPGYRNVNRAQFSTNNALRLYIHYANSSGQLKLGLFSMIAAGEKESQLDYLALGDSFSSGEGAYNYKSTTDTRDPFNKCHLSLLSYPFILASRTNLNKSQSVACSGAKMKDISSSDTSKYNSDLKQSEGKISGSFDSEIYGNFLVGYRTQNSFVSLNKPNLVTMSISGNDIGFGSILTACIAPGTCFVDPQDKANLVQGINSKFDDMVSTFSSVKSSAGTPSKIYAIGYPLLADPGGNCALNVRLNHDELIFANQVVVYLNSVIQKASSKAGVTYVSVENAFTGHRLCETSGSSLAVNGLTAGDDKAFSISLPLLNRPMDVNIIGRESYHPNVLGHRLYADAILSATNNMSVPDSAPNQSVASPTLSDATPILGTATAALPAKKLIFDESISNNILLHTGLEEVRVSGFISSSTVTVRLKSQEPANTVLTLGVLKADPKGVLAATLSIPNSAQKTHIIEFAGKNPSGEEITIQKVIYIAASAEDIDGDGILNSSEKCLVVEPSNQDSDADNIDDACDPQIAQAIAAPMPIPAPIPTPTPPSAQDPAPSQAPNQSGSPNDDQNTNTASLNQNGGLGGSESNPSTIPVVLIDAPMLHTLNTPLSPAPESSNKILVVKTQEVLGAIEQLTPVADIKKSLTGQKPGKIKEKPMPYIFLLLLTPIAAVNVLAYKYWRKNS